jgi:hypothetical protein
MKESATNQTQSNCPSLADTGDTREEVEEVTQLRPPCRGECFTQNNTGTRTEGGGDGRETGRRGRRRSPHHSSSSSHLQHTGAVIDTGRGHPLPAGHPHTQRTLPPRRRGGGDKRTGRRRMCRESNSTVYRRGRVSLTVLSPKIKLTNSGQNPTTSKAITPLQVHHTGTHRGTHRITRGLRMKTKTKKHAPTPYWSAV